MECPSDLVEQMFKQANTRVPLLLGLGVLNLGQSSGWRVLESAKQTSKFGEFNSKHHNQGNAFRCET